MLLFHEQQPAEKLREKQCQCFFFTFFPKLNSDHESILQISNPGILALKMGQT